MQKINKKLAFIIIGIAASASNGAMAESDMVLQERVLKAREMAHQQHAEHQGHDAGKIDKSKEFHGVFYGFLPCSDCNGIKSTLSLKQNNNYLLVTQPARESSREYYEKGKYTWNDDTQTVTLTPRNSGSVGHQYYIENDGTLIQINDRKGSDTERYTLRRSDTVKAREVHIH